MDVGTVCTAFSRDTVVIYMFTASSSHCLTQVDPNGVTLNIYIDGDGEPQYIPIGNLDDMRQVEVNEIGGIPVEVAY